MTTMRLALSGCLLALALGSPASAGASSAGSGDSPAVFNRDGASAVGRARQHYDRAQYEQYRGDPGAQFQLRQKRQNLCRNVPEMC